MWEHPATTAAVAKLGQWGVRFIPVGEGRTACGEVGDGRLAEPEEIVAAVEASLERPVRRLRVLVTTGGTAEPVVPCACSQMPAPAKPAPASRIASRSPATTSSSFTQGARRSARLRCAERRFLHSRTGFGPGPNPVLGALRRAVIHAAAVSDYSVENVVVDGAVLDPKGKLDSGLAPVIHLRPNPKLVDGLRARSLNESLRVVAFKLTYGENREGVRRAVSALFGHCGADLIVHNDLSERRGAEAFPSEIHFQD